MDDLVKNPIERKPRSFLKERISRFKPVAIIRKNSPLFIFLLVLLLTFLLGVWDIRRYEIYDSEGSDINEEVLSQVEVYFREEIFGNNYFVFSPMKTSEDMYLSIPKLKSVRIEKVVPDKVVVFVQTYEEKYVASLRDSSCEVLSAQGIVLDSICEEEGQGCCEEYAKEKSLIIFSSLDVEASVFEDDKDRLLIMEEVKKVVTVMEAFKYQVQEITLANEILEIMDIDGRLFRFTISRDIDVQLRRLIVVLAKANSEYMEFSSLDLRFERPVMLD
jgi:hypothetical protein